MKMKKKSQSRVKHLTLFALFCLAGCLLQLVSGCSGAEEFNIASVPEVAYTYEWKDEMVEDTVVWTCQQSLSFETDEGKTQQYALQAVVKIYVTKDDIRFGSNRKPEPELKDKDGTSSTSGNYPEKVLTTHLFELEDGQTVVADVRCERFFYTTNGEKLTLPYMNVTDVNFVKGEAAAIDGHPNMWDAVVFLKADWQVEGRKDKNSLTPAIHYVKEEVKQTDVLLNTSYSSGYKWLNDNTFQLYVDEIATWSISGEKKYRYASPELVFEFVGKANKTQTVSNFDFTGKLRTAQGKKENIGATGWTIKKGMVTHTLAFSNGSETFDDVFTYPAYEASYMVNGRTFNFDLSIEFSEMHKMEKKSSTTAVNTTTARATLLEKAFTQTVSTTLNVQTAPDPDSDSDSDSDLDPSRPYGKIIGYDVSAVFNVDALTIGGQITEKCVCIRYEEGYEWGVCAYEEAFPAQMTYVQSGYTGFNSAAKNAKQTSYRLARAETSAQGMKWYAEDNSLISAIDALTCKVYGWKNVVSGQYSTVVEGYSGKLSSSNYVLTLTANDGEVRVFKSSPL